MLLQPWNYLGSANTEAQGAAQEVAKLLPEGLNCGPGLARDPLDACDVPLSNGSHDALHFRLNAEVDYDL